MRVFCAMVVLGLLALPTGAAAEPPKSAAVRGSRPARAKPRATGGALLLGTAFRTKGGGGEVILQTSTEVELEPRAGAGASRATYLLKRCRILRNNDRRPLDTRFFDSPVTGVTFSQRGPDVEVGVSLREETPVEQPHTRKEQGPGGTWYWVLGFARATSAHRAPAAANP